MPLRSIEISGYRWIEHGRLTFNDTTFAFGENDSGRNAIIEALRLTLGSRDATLDKLLQPQHFHRLQDSAVDELRVRVEVEESEPGSWELPARMAAAYPADAARPRMLIF